MAIVAVPVVLAIILAGISFLGRSISPGSAFNFALTTLPLYGYVVVGGLLLVGVLANMNRPSPAEGNAFLSTLVLGWALGLIPILAALLAGWLQRPR